MSSKSETLELLLAFGRIRRQLNLRATQLLKPMGIGPKQGLVLRELATGAVCLSELARSTQTDPGATGKVVETLLRKGWVRRTDHPEDRRRWQVSLTAVGRQAARRLETVYARLAEEFASPLPESGRRALLESFTGISRGLAAHLETEAT